MAAPCIWSHPVAIRILRRLHGASRSLLVEASDGFLYVVKSSENPQGPNVLFNEAVGTELYHACGLPTARWSPIVVCDSEIQRFWDYWPESDADPIRPGAGLWFGSRFIGQLKRKSYDILPGSHFARIRNRNAFWLAWIVDCCANQTDLRQCVFLEDRSGGFHAVFIDHGCLFGGPDGSKCAKVQSGQYFDGRMYPQGWQWTTSHFRTLAGSLSCANLRRRIESIPKKWRTETANRHVGECLDRLLDVDFVESVAHKIVKAHDKQADDQMNMHLNACFCPDGDGILPGGI
jgi:hypothetical protein